MSRLSSLGLYNVLLIGQFANFTVQKNLRLPVSPDLGISSQLTAIILADERRRTATLSWVDVVAMVDTPNNKTVPE